jgi:hypothetical protein
MAVTPAPANTMEKGTVKKIMVVNSILLKNEGKPERRRNKPFKTKRNRTVQTRK